MTREEMIREIEEKLENQPDFVVKSIEWFVSHIDLAKRLCESSEPLTGRELEQEIAKAVKTQDHAYYALLQYQKVIQEQREAER